MRLVNFVSKINIIVMLDVGLTTFMILATSLVMLMTPGLAFFYGGLGCNKNILSIMMQSFVSMGIGTVLWFAFGYSLCFSGNMSSGSDFFGIIGNFDKAFYHGITPSTLYSSDKPFPEYIFIPHEDKILGIIDDLEKIFFSASLKMGYFLYKNIFFQK